MDDDLYRYEYLSSSFRFTPEVKINKSIMRNGARGEYRLDLEIDMFLTLSIPARENRPAIFEEAKVATVVVEFDGNVHLKDESVRADKERDSMIQGMGKTVFRIQTPYKHSGPDSTKAYKTALSELVQRQIGDIKEHFRNVMYRQHNISNLINEALANDGVVYRFDPANLK